MDYYRTVAGAKFSFRDVQRIPRDRVLRAGSADLPARGGLSLDLGVVQAADGELVVHAPEQRPAAVLRSVVQNNFRKCGKAAQKDDSGRIVLTSSM